MRQFESNNEARGLERFMWTLIGFAIIGALSVLGWASWGVGKLLGLL